MIQQYNSKLVYWVNFRAKIVKFSIQEMKGKGHEPSLKFLNSSYGSSQLSSDSSLVNNKITELVPFFYHLINHLTNFSKMVPGTKAIPSIRFDMILTKQDYFNEKFLSTKAISQALKMVISSSNKDIVLVFFSKVISLLPTKYVPT